MSRGWRTFLLTNVALGLASAPALAQVQPMGTVPRAVRPTPAPIQVQPRPATAPVRPATKTAPDALAPSNPDFKDDQQPEAAQSVAVPLPLPPVVWDVASAQELLAYIERIGVEGLNPADYDPA
jgi:hypothetical protein